MKECGKRKSHVSSKLHMIYISSNNVRHTVIKTFTTLHPTSLHSTSLHLSTLHFLSFKLHPTTLHYHLISLTSFKFPIAPFHLTSLHFTSLRCTFRPSKLRIKVNAVDKLSYCLLLQIKQISVIDNIILQPSVFVKQIFRFHSYTVHQQYSTL